MKNIFKKKLAKSFDMPFSLFWYLGFYFHPVSKSSLSVRHTKTHTGRTDERTEIFCLILNTKFMFLYVHQDLLINILV